MIRTLGRDLRVVGSLIRGRRDDSPESLDAFYGPQAFLYDSFRERLLSGREDLVRRLQPAAGEYWIELGAGTGYNAEFLGERASRLRRLDMVDICRPLLEVARRRSERWPTAHVIRADAASYRPPTAADVVYFSYSLSMMRNWRAAVDNALDIVRPGGRIGVVDFFVSAAQPASGRARHGFLTRTCWPLWFARDGVRLDHRLPDYLLSRLRNTELTEEWASIPYLPGLRVPYFTIVGERR